MNVRQRHCTAIRGRVRVVLGPVAIVLILLGSWPAYSQTAAKTLVQQVGLDQHLNAQMPHDLKFRDERGRTVRLGDYFNKQPVVLTLVYFRCPMLCTQVLNGLLESSQAIEKTMGTDYQVVTISIDPRETTAMARAKKKRYAESYHRPGADEGWHFLTGSAAAIDQLATSVGYRYQYDSRTDQFAHASGIIVLTPTGRISRYLYGIDFVPDELQSAIVDASEQRIGSLSDRFLLLCFHYDPATGKYGFAIDRAIRAAGVATIIVMASYLWVMFRRERRQTPAVFIEKPGAGFPTAVEE